MRSFLRHRFGGFTLIDTAMGLMVLGLLIAGAAAAFKLHVRDSQIKTTYANSQLVARAMENFIHQNASFPCPAAVNLTPDNPMYGVSANCTALTGYDAAGNPGPVVGPGGFAGGIFVEEGTLDSTRRIVRGMIPFKTLNLPESFAYDGHKQRLFYALSADQANEVTFAADAGAIAVVGADGALGPTATQKTHFLIFSAGRDGRGAYAKSGAQILPCGVGLDAENCNTATGPNAKAVYRTAAAANTDGTATNFDDYFLPDNSIIIPLWKEDPSNDGNIHDIKGQKIVVGGDPADPKTAAILDVKIDVMGAARARVDELGAKGIGDSKGNALADDYCDENKGACFGAELIAGNELAMDCNTAFGARPAGPAMTGIGDAEAKCGPLAFNFACPAGMALTGVGAGGAPICSYICAPDTGSQFYNCPAPHTTGRVEERRDMDCTLSPPNWGPWMYYDDDCCTPTSQTEPNAPCPAGYAGTYSRTRDYTCPAAAWGAWVPAALPAPPSCIPIVNGVCGSADGQRLATQPSGGALCSAGADTAVSGGATGPVWTWDCNGTPAGFGTTDNCSATYGVDGVCGPDSGPTTATAPTDPGLCTAGTPTAVTYTGSGWNWTCNGLGAGAPSPGCSAPETLVNGTCGTANGNAFASAPSGGTLCNTGSVAAAPSGAGPWNWTCDGSGAGGSENCTAVPTVAPSCGGTVDYIYQITLANELNDDTVTCPSTHRSIPIYGSPLVGTLPVVRPLAVSSFCVADAACSGGGSCTLSGSSTPTDADVISDCASSLGYTQGSDFAYAFVIERSPGDYVVCHNNSSIMGLACAGSYGGEFWWDAMPPCAGAFPACPAGGTINGTCGPDSGTATATAPTDPGLCASGTPSAVSGSGPFTWSCNGSGPGHTDDNTCSAPLPAGPGCVLAPITTAGGGMYPNIKNWDGTAGDMATPGPFNLCQATNYVAAVHGGNEIFGSYALCGALGAGDFSANGACLKEVTADCGGNLSCASNCAMGVHECAGGPPVVNGACGPDSGTATATAPTNPGLCATGTPGAVSGTGPFTWSCNGSGPGHTDDNTCSAPLAAGGTCLSQACPSPVTCTAGSVVDNTYIDPWDMMRYGSYDTTWSCTDGNSYVTGSNSDTTDHAGQTFSYCGANTPGYCVHRSHPMTNGGPVQNYYVCLTIHGEEIFGYPPGTWQKYADIPAVGQTVVVDFPMPYTPSDTVQLDQTQGSTVLADYLTKASGSVWAGLYQSPYPVGMSGSCKPTTPAPTCAATATCTYVNTTRVDASTEYSTYTCDNGGNYITPNYYYVGPMPYPASRWYLANTQITVPKNVTTGGDTSCGGAAATACSSVTGFNAADGSIFSCNECANVAGFGYTLAYIVESFHNCDIGPCGPRPTPTPTPDADAIAAAQAALGSAGLNPANYDICTVRTSKSCPAPGCDAWFDDSIVNAYAVPKPAGITPAMDAACPNWSGGTGVSCEVEYNYGGVQQYADGNYYCAETFTNEYCSGRKTCYANAYRINPDGSNAGGLDPTVTTAWLCNGTTDANGSHGQCGAANNTVSPAQPTAPNLCFGTVPVQTPSFLAGDPTYWMWNCSTGFGQQATCVAIK